MLFSILPVLLLISNDVQVNISRFPHGHRADLLRSDLIIRSWPRPHGASHLIACSRTRTATLLDPEESEKELYQQELDSLKLSVRYKLHSIPPVVEVAPGQTRQYTRLLERLGTSMRSDLGSPSKATYPWESTPIIRPTSCRHGGMSVELGGMTVSIDSESNRQLTVPQLKSPEKRTTEDDSPIYGEVRIALGVFHLELIPLDGLRLAFRIKDRVFLSGERDGIHPRLRLLPGHTLLYGSGRCPSGPWISSVQQELFEEEQIRWHG